MKHNLLRNFLALVLSGIMLAGVGCKNYDDDIDKSTTASTSCT